MNVEFYVSSMWGEFNRYPPEQIEAACLDGDWLCFLPHQWMAGLWAGAEGRYVRISNPIWSKHKIVFEVDFENRRLRVL